jgi:hypothetical protein
MFRKEVTKEKPMVGRIWRRPSSGVAIAFDALMLAMAGGVAVAATTQVLLGQPVLSADQVLGGSIENADEWLPNSNSHGGDFCDAFSCSPPLL